MLRSADGLQIDQVYVALELVSLIPGEGEEPLCQVITAEEEEPFTSKSHLKPLVTTASTGIQDEVMVFCPCARRSYLTGHFLCFINRICLGKCVACCSGLYSVPFVVNC